MHMFFYYACSGYALKIWEVVKHFIVRCSLHLHHCYSFLCHAVFLRDISRQDGFKRNTVKIKLSLGQLCSPSSLYSWGHGLCCFSKAQSKDMMLSYLRATVTTSESKIVGSF